MPRKWKKCISLFVALGILLLLPGMAGAEPVKLTLEQARELALTQGTASLLLELGQEQAEKSLNMVRRQFGLGAVGVSDSRTQKEQIDELEAVIDEKLEKIKLLEEEIDGWKEEQAGLEEGSQEAAGLQRKIDGANAKIAEHRQVIDDLRPALAHMIPRYYQTKSLEDMAKSSLDPVVSSVDAVTDALQTQPKVIDYNVENLFLSLLAMDRQEEHLKKTLAFLQKMHERELVLFKLGMSTSLKVDEAGASVQGGEEGLKSLRAGKDNLKRIFLNLLGLPVDFAFTLQPVELSTSTIDLDKMTAPDLTRSVRYQRAESNLRKKIEELEDTSKSDSNKYRLAELAVTEAEINLQDALKGLQVNYESRRDCLSLAQKALENARLALENAQKSKKQAELKYKVGFISGVEMEQQELAVEEAELKYRSALNDLYLATRAYILAREGIELQEAGVK